MGLAIKVCTLQSRKPLFLKIRPLFIGKSAQWSLYMNQSLKLCQFFVRFLFRLSECQTEMISGRT